MFNNIRFCFTEICKVKSYYFIFALSNLIIKIDNQMGTKQTKCQISDEAIIEIRKSLELRLEIRKLWEISETTLYRWLTNRNPLLTSADTVRLIAKNTKIKESQILN